MVFAENFFMGILSWEFFFIGVFHAIFYENFFQELFQEEAEFHELRFQ